MRSRLARLVATILVLLWVGPVQFVQTDSWRQLKMLGAPEGASAESQVIPAGMAIVLEPNTVLKLRLRDGSTVEGRFLRRTLLDSALYAPRFAARARGSSYLPIALGETLRVSVRDGREWTAPFAGYGERTLLLRGPDGTQDLRVPFESALEIRRANGDQVEPSALLQAFRTGLLPSAEALELEERLREGGMGPHWGGAFRVAVDDIESATAELSPGVSVGGVVLLGVLVGAVLAVVLVGAMIHSATHPKCGGSVVNVPPFLTVHLTTRPFDRSRGCYVGDPLAVPDPRPGPGEGGPVGPSLTDPPRGWAGHRRSR